MTTKKWLKGQQSVERIFLCSGPYGPLKEDEIISEIEALSYVSDITEDDQGHITDRGISGAIKFKELPVVPPESINKIIVTAKNEYGYLGYLSLYGVRIPQQSATDNKEWVYTAKSLHSWHKERR